MLWEGSEDWYRLSPEQRPFRCWLDDRIAEADAETAERFAAYVKWVHTTSGGPIDRKAADRPLKWFETPASIALGKIVLDALLQAHEYHYPHAMDGAEIRMAGYLTWVMVARGEDAYLTGVFERLIVAQELGLALRLNLYLLWRDGGSRGSDLARSIAAATDSNPCFTDDPAWLGAVAAGIADVVPDISRLYRWGISFTLHDGRQLSSLGLSREKRIYPQIVAAFDYPQHPTNRWSLKLERFWPNNLDLGIRWHRGLDDEIGSVWPPIEAAEVSSLPTDETALRAEAWPGLAGPAEIPAMVAWIEKRFAISFDLDAPQFFGGNLKPKVRKMIGAWLKTSRRQ
jgi:hypothetical protein